MKNKISIFLSLGVLFIIFFFLKDAGISIELSNDSNTIKTECENSFDLVDLTNDNFKGISFDGQYAVVFFWTTWCGNCKAILPNTIAVCQEKKIDLILVNNDSMNKDKVKQVYCEYGFAKGYYLSEKNTMFNVLKDTERISQFMKKSEVTLIKTLLILTSLLLIKDIKL